MKRTLLIFILMTIFPFISFGAPQEVTQSAHCEPEAAMPITDYACCTSPNINSKDSLWWVAYTAEIKNLKRLRQICFNVNFDWSIPNRYNCDLSTKVYKMDISLKTNSTCKIKNWTL